ncbi:MAG: porin [Gammaproteobacteria bacterium]
MRKIVTAAAALIAVSAFATAAHAADPDTIGYLSEHTTLGVKIYSDMSYIQNSSDGVNVDPTGYGFDVKRGYITFDTAFDETWSVQVRTDFEYCSTCGATELYFKNIFAQAMLGNGMKLRIGEADMPWIPHMEDLYGYRYVENVLIDEYKFGNSSDWGLHLLGDEGKLNWQVSLVDGGGYKHPERTKGMDLEGRVDYNVIGGLHLVLGAYAGDRGANTTETAADNTASRYDAAAVYEGSNWNAGVDYFYANDWNNVTTPYTTGSDGYSIFGSYDLTPIWSIFARYDSLKPCKDLSSATSANCYSDTKSTYYNVGVQYIASKQIDFAFVYKYDKVDNGIVSTANGNIGGDPTANGPGYGTYQEVGVWMQAAF